VELELDGEAESSSRVLKTHLTLAVVSFGFAQDRLSPHHERNLKPLILRLSKGLRLSKDRRHRSAPC
jgi:hypothetical protein